MLRCTALKCCKRLGVCRITAPWNHWLTAQKPKGTRLPVPDRIGRYPCYHTGSFWTFCSFCSRFSKAPPSRPSRPCCSWPLGISRVVPRPDWLVYGKFMPRNMEHHRTHRNSSCFTWWHEVTWYDMTHRIHVWYIWYYMKNIYHQYTPVMLASCAQEIPEFRTLNRKMEVPKKVPLKKIGESPWNHLPNRGWNWGCLGINCFLFRDLRAMTDKNVKWLTRNVN